MRLEQAIAVIDTLDDAAPVPQQMEAYLTQAKTALPNQPEVYWYLGVAAVRRGAKDAAAENSRHVLALLPAGSPDRTMVQQAITALE